MLDSFLLQNALCFTIHKKRAGGSKTAQWMLGHCPLGSIERFECASTIWTMVLWNWHKNSLIIDYPWHHRSGKAKLIFSCTAPVRFFFFFFGGGDIGRLDSRGFRILLSTDSVVESRGFASVNDDRELRPFWLMDRLRCAATLRPNYSAAHAGETTIERAGDRSAEAKATDTAKVNNCTSTATGQVQEEEDFVIEDYDDWSQPLSAPSVYLFTYFLPPPSLSRRSAPTTSSGTTLQPSLITDRQIHIGCQPSAFCLTH